MSDIAVRFGYVPVQDSDDPHSREPAFGIYSSRFANQREKAMWAIPLSSAYKYTDSSYMMRACFAIAQFLGMQPDQFLINRISSTIEDNLTQLLLSKPAGEVDGQEYGEVELKIDDQVVSEFAVKNNGEMVK